MADWIATGRAAELILVLTLFEALALVVYHRRTGSGLMPDQFLPNMLAGDFLLLAWIASAHAAPWPYAAAALLAALLCHMMDVVLRWR
jgi:hypothetical protein